MGILFKMKRDIFTFPFLFRHWLLECGTTIALDTETNSLNYLDLDIVGFSICDGKQACYVDLRGKYREELLGLLQFYLIEKCKLVIMHSAPFDLKVLKKVGIEI